MSHLFKNLKNLLRRFSTAMIGDRGNVGIPMVIVLGGATVVAMQFMLNSATNEVKQTNSDLIRNVGLQNNVAAVKAIENLTQPATNGWNSTDASTQPLVYPNPYLPYSTTTSYISSGSKKTVSKTEVVPQLFQPIKTSLNTNPDKPGYLAFNNGKLTITTPDYDKISASDLALIYSGNGMPSGKVKTITITKATPIKDPNYQMLITHYQVDATVTEMINGRATSKNTTALVAVPPPPGPTCSLVFDFPSYRVSQQTNFTLTVTGVATSVALVWDDSGKQFMNNVSIAGGSNSLTSVNRVRGTGVSPSPLNVKDGLAQATQTYHATVYGVKNDSSTCDGSYTLMLPAMCELSSPKMELAPGECTTWKAVIDPKDATQNLSSVSDSPGNEFANFTNHTFCMPYTANVDDIYTIGLDVADSIGASSCTKDFSAIAASKAPACAYLDPAVKTDVWFYIQYLTNPPGWAKFSFNINDANVGEVKATSDSPTNTTPCPDTSLCFAYNFENTERNLFIEVANYKKSSCTITGLNRIDLGCFDEDSQISIDGKVAKSAKEFKRGDKAFNPVTAAQAEIGKITVGFEFLPMITIKTGSGRGLTVTTEHPILTQRGIVMAELLEVGDSVRAQDGSWQKITLIESNLSNHKVWNFEINSGSTKEEDHMLLADGIVSGDLYLQNKLKEQYNAKRNVAKSP